MKKIAVVLSGCGVYDGAEIHEATLTLLALDRAGASYICAAPDVKQAKVYNHLSNSDEKGETRNVAVEAARIARGNLTLLKDLKVSQLDGVIIPGGYGAALNLSTFATAGADMDINPELKSLLKEFISQKKPVAALCIAPPILARVFKELGVKGVKLTIGNDRGVASAINAMGAEHVNCPADSCVVDETHKVVTCPAYMLAGGIAELYMGIEKTVQALLTMA